MGKSYWFNLADFCYRKAADLLHGDQQRLLQFLSWFSGGAVKNQNRPNVVALLVLLALLGAGCGCATLCGINHECGCGLDSCPGCGCADSECNCGAFVGSGSDRYCGADGCRGSGCCPLSYGHRQLRIEIGPPAVRFRPEMPPEFLPVPVTPVYANVNPNAPPETRGAVEVGWAPPYQLTVYGRD